MSRNALDETRAYINDARSRGVGAVSPAAVARRLGITEDQAVALLNCLVETEGILKLSGYLSCPDCNDVVPLSGVSLPAIIHDAERRTGSRCPFCDTLIPSTDDLKVKLSFFCVAAGSGGMNLAAQSPAPSPPPSLVADLAHLKAIQGINCNNLILASHGSTVLVGESISQAAGGGMVAAGPVQQVTKLAVSTAIAPEKRAAALVRNNPWISGSFYMTLAVAVIACLAAVGKIVSPWALPPIIMAAVLLVCAIGAFQLRNDEKLTEVNFLSLMGMTFRALPLVRSFRKSDPLNTP